MKKVLFINAVDPHVEIESRYLPLWPCYLAAYADKVLPAGSVEFRLMRKPVTQELDEFAPDLVAVSAVSQNFNRVAPLASAAKSRLLPVIVGGVHVSALPDTLPEQADVAVIGEAEQTFAELLRILLDTGRLEHSRLESVRGVAFRSAGRLIRTPPRPLIDNLDTLPHPDRSLIGYPRHSYMFTSRGCPYRCVFCSSSRFWDKVRFASAEYVVSEIEELVSHGVHTVSFYDDLFAANLKRLEEIADLIASKGLDREVRFTCSCRANVVTPRVVSALRKMNVVSVGMGLESGNPRVLEYLKGGVTVEDNRRAVALLKDAGIQANASFVIGSPDETEAEVMDTYSFISRNPLDFVDTYVLTPLPGTPIWDDALSRGLVSNDMDWSRLDVNFGGPGRAVILSKTLSPANLALLYARFRRQRFWRILKALPGSPWLADVPRVAFAAAVASARRALSWVTRAPRA